MARDDAGVIGRFLAAVDASGLLAAIHGPGEEAASRERPCLLWAVAGVREKPSLDSQRVRSIGLEFAFHHDPRSTPLERIAIEDQVHEAMAAAIDADTGLAHGPWLSGFGSELWGKDRATLSYPLTGA